MSRQPAQSASLYATRFKKLPISKNNSWLVIPQDIEGYDKQKLNINSEVFAWIDWIAKYQKKKKKSKRVMVK